MDYARNETQTQLENTYCIMTYRESPVVVNNSITARPNRVKFEETSSSFALYLSEYTADFFRTNKQQPPIS